MTKSKTAKPLGTSCPVILGAELHVFSGSQILLFKRSSLARRFPNVWVAPGGHVDENEDPLTAALRETEEETGVRVNRDRAKLRAIATHHHHERRETFLLFLFSAKITKIRKVRRANHEGEPRWIKIREAKSNPEVFYPVRYYLPFLLGEKNKILFTNIEWRNSKIVKIHSWIES